MVFKRTHLYRTETVTTMDHEWSVVHWQSHAVKDTSGPDLSENLISYHRHPSTVICHYSRFVTEQVLPSLMSCLGKILAGVVFRCLLVVYDSEYSSPMMVMFLFYGHDISTPCQTNSINVLNELITYTLIK